MFNPVIHLSILISVSILPMRESISATDWAQRVRFLGLLLLSNKRPISSWANISLKKISFAIVNST